MTRRTLTRREMYDLVWSMPVATVAAGFQISDVTLKRICDRYRVPTPPNNYWTRKKAGQKVKQALFHHAVRSRDEVIVIDPDGATLLENASASRTLRRPRQGIPPAHVSAPAIQPLVHVHEAVAATAWVLRNATPGENGAVTANGEGLCGITISADHAERVIYLLDGLARKLDGHSLALTPGGSEMCIKNGPDQIELTLTERVQRSQHEPTPDEVAAEKGRQKKRAHDARLGLWSPDEGRVYPEFDVVRTGELAFVIASDAVYGCAPRRTWRDTRRQSLDTMLDNVAQGIVRYLAAVKFTREQQERDQEEERVYWRRVKLEKARSNREYGRLAFVRKVVNVHREIGELRSVLNVYQTRPYAESEGALARMLTWSEARLASLEKRVTPKRLNARLKKQSLFPERDDIVEELHALPPTVWTPDGIYPGWDLSRD